jgi:hypothetical protein
MVRAEITTVGERTQSILELDVGQTAGASQTALQAALCAVLLSMEDQEAAFFGADLPRFKVAGDLMMNTTG